MAEIHADTDTAAQCAGESNDPAALQRLVEVPVPRLSFGIATWIWQ
jgi:hypothetical protein